MQQRDRRRMIRSHFNSPNYTTLTDMIQYSNNPNFTLRIAY